MIISEINTSSATGVSKQYKCCSCEQQSPCVVKIDKKLICLKCRFKDIGKEAFYEPLHNGSENE